MEDLHGYLYCLRGAEIVGYPPHSQDHGQGLGWEVWVGGSHIVAVNGARNIVSSSEAKVIDCSGLIIAPGLVDMHMFICGDCGMDGYEARTPEATVNDVLEAGITSLVGLLGSDSKTRTPLTLISKARRLKKEGLLSCFVCSGAKNHASPLPCFTSSVSTDFMTVSEMVGRGTYSISDNANFNNLIHLAPSELVKEATECFHQGNLCERRSLFYCRVGAKSTYLDPLRDMSLMFPQYIPQILPTVCGDSSKTLLEDAESWILHDGGCLNISAAVGAEITARTLLHYLLRPAFPIDKITVSSEAYLSSHHHSSSQENAEAYPNRAEAPSPKRGEGSSVSFTSPTVLLEMVRCLHKKHHIDIKVAFDLVSANPAHVLGVSDKKGKVSVGFDADLLLLDKGSLKLVAVINQGKFVKYCPTSDSRDSKQASNSGVSGPTLLEARDWLRSRFIEPEQVSEVLESREHSRRENVKEEAASHQPESTSVDRLIEPQAVTTKRLTTIDVLNETNHKDKVASGNLESAERISLTREGSQSNKAQINQRPSNVSSKVKNEEELDDVRLRSPSPKRKEHSRSAPRSPTNNSYLFTSPPPPPPRSSRSSPRLSSPRPPPPPPTPPHSISSDRHSQSSPPTRSNYVVYSADSHDATTLKSTMSSPRLSPPTKAAPAPPKSDNAMLEVEKSDDDEHAMLEVEKSEQLRVRLALLRNATKSKPSGLSFLSSASPSSEADSRSETKSETQDRLKREAERLNKLQEESTLNKQANYKSPRPSKSKSSNGSQALTVSSALSPTSTLSSTSSHDMTASIKEADEELERDIALTLQSLASPIKPSSSSSLTSPAETYTTSSSPFPKERGVSPRSSSAGRAESPDRPFHHKQGNAGFSIGSGGDTIVEIARHPSLGYEDGGSRDSPFTSESTRPSNTPDRINKSIDFSPAAEKAIQGKEKRNDDKEDDGLDFDLKLPDDEEITTDLHKTGSFVTQQRTLSERTPSRDEDEDSSEASWEGDMLDFVGRDLMDRNHVSSLSAGRASPSPSKSVSSPQQANSSERKQPESPSSPPKPQDPSNRLLMFSGLAASSRRKSF